MKIAIKFLIPILVTFLILDINAATSTVSNKSQLKNAGVISKLYINN